MISFAGVTALLLVLMGRPIIPMELALKAKTLTVESGMAFQV